MTEASVLRFPAPRSCLVCRHASFPQSATWCHEYDEEIAHEASAAADCPAYERDEDR